MSFFMLALASSGVAAAQTVPSSVSTAQPLGVVGSAAATFQRAVATVTNAVVPAQPAQSAYAKLAAPFATEAAWLYRAGWPLYALIDRYSAATAPLDEEANCIATAVYFEARGETPEGQLAVARVVMNRAASGKYPSSWCATVKQPWQFSFVRHGRFPAVDTGSYAWRKAQAVTRLAISNAVPSLPTDVLWYHANYVAPSWRRNLTRVDQIGAHIFYRA